MVEVVIEPAGPALTSLKTGSMIRIPPPLPLVLLPLIVLSETMRVAPTLAMPPPPPGSLASSPGVATLLREI